MQFTVSGILVIDHYYSKESQDLNQYCLIEIVVSKMQYC